MVSIHADINEEKIMKSIVYAILAAIALVSALSGCGTIKQESAMEWMQRQPWIIDP